MNVPLNANQVVQHLLDMSRQLEKVQTLQTRIDVGRTYGATIRAEVLLAGVGAP